MALSLSMRYTSGMESWLGIDWSEALQNAGILVAIYSNYDGKRARCVDNLARFTRDHREIWTEFHKTPDQKRVLDPKANLDAQPLSLKEEMFTITLILHLNSVYRSIKADQMTELPGLPDDIREFFALPIPLKVWRDARRFQTKDFVEFVERAIRHHCCSPFHRN
jgi:hypothetical protein